MSADVTNVANLVSTLPKIHAAERRQRKSIRFFGVAFSVNISLRPDVEAFLPEDALDWALIVTTSVFFKQRCSASSRRCTIVVTGIAFVI